MDNKSNGSNGSNRSYMSDRYNFVVFLRCKDS